MDLKLKEKIAICYTCCGPTYRKSAYNKIKNYYFDHEDIYYCILTDDKEYFKDLDRKNLIVNELEDFREEFPKLKDKEVFLKSSDKNDYAKKWVDQGYLFPFSTYRFNVLQAIKLNIKNVALLCTDTTINFDANFFNDEMFSRTEMFYNAVSEWDQDANTFAMEYPIKILKEKYNLPVDSKIRILDAAARMYIPESLESLKKFFNIWNDIIETLYENNEIHHFRGSYVISDEYILAPIYNALKLNKRHCHCLQMPFDNPSASIFDVRHNAIYERFWRFGGDGKIQENINYEEFLKINNLPDYD
jgi:hypothetical protein